MQLVPIGKEELDRIQQSYVAEFGEGNVDFFRSVNGYAIGTEVRFLPSTGVPSINSGSVTYIMVVKNPRTGFLVVTHHDPDKGERRVRTPFPVHATVP